MLWCVAALDILWQGTRPDAYLIQVRGITAPQPYPFASVGIELLIAAVVLALLAWALSAQSWQRVGRLTCCAVFVTAVGVAAAAGSMHMPAHYLHFAMFMLATSVLSIGCWLSFLIRAWIGRPR